MKNKLNISGVLLILTINLIHSCKKDEPNPPTVETSDVTEISYRKVTAGGNLINIGSAPIIARGVCWDTLGNPTIANKNTKTISNSGPGTFVSFITLLTPNTTYYVRAYATNSIGTSYGNQVSFTTLPVEIPGLTTSAITSVTQKTAGSGGNITDEKGEPVIARGVCWDTSSIPTIELTTKTTNNTGPGVFTSSITGLTAGTTYYVRAYATNSEGTGYGNEISFITDPATLPVITTTEVSSITLTTAISGGNVTNDGGVPAAIRGVCWSTAPNPTTANNKVTDDGTGIGQFTGNITELEPNTTYYLRAYATNSAGTGYGNELIFKTYVVTDIEGNGYYSVTIGTQIWMTENLKTTKYNDNSAIPNVTDGAAWATLSTPAYCWYNNNEGTYKASYGALYNWYSVGTGKLCPMGWHVPTDAEWTILTDYLTNNGYGYGGRRSDIAKSMAATTGWTISTIAGTVGNDQASNNSSGFTGLTAGTRSFDGSFAGGISNWWSSIEFNTSNAWYRVLISSATDIGRGIPYKKSGMSVRCLKD